MNLSAHHIACTKLLRRCDVMDQSALHIRVRERRARLGREERLITIHTQPVVSSCRCPRDGQRRLHGNHARQEGKERAKDISAQDSPTEDVSHFPAPPRSSPSPHAKNASIPRKANALSVTASPNSSIVPMAKEPA